MKNTRVELVRYKIRGVYSTWDPLLRGGGGEGKKKKVVGGKKFKN